MKPSFYQYEIDGHYYKRGSHGFTYMWVNDRWIKSSFKLPVRRKG